MLMVIGNFNAKAGSKYPQYKDEIGKYGKELKNSNGDTLLQLAKEKKLILTNILFSHKLALQTIWTPKECLMNITITMAPSTRITAEIR